MNHANQKPSGALLAIVGGAEADELTEDQGYAVRALDLAVIAVTTCPGVTLNMASAKPVRD
jgi:hypothetical protein